MANVSDKSKVKIAIIFGPFKVQYKIKLIGKLLYIILIGLFVKFYSLEI